MSLFLYNTTTGKKQSFTPLDPNSITMYLCGPTVYGYAHIGNARPAVVFDVLYRLLKYHYSKVTYARNITDIDDKINKSALSLGVNIKNYAGKYAKIYNRDIEQLGVLPPDIEPYATAHIPQIIAMINQLIDKGHAYAAQGHVLFAVESYADYGSLSNRKIEDMIAGARVEVAPYKKHPADFVLWKPSDETLPGWNSPWGRGRPGWHIECSAMCKSHLGDTIDIHCGGRDLIFPHHENEAAQSCCANSTKSFANYWLHNGMINMGQQKMSKSLGNILLIKDVAAQYKGEVIRWLLLSAQYRQSVTWSEDSIHKAQKTMDRIYAALRNSQSVIADINRDNIPVAIIKALDDDLNTPIVFAEINKIAKQLAKAESNTDKKLFKSQLLSIGELLGFFQENAELWFKSADIDSNHINKLIEQREQARANHDWSKSDQIRDELNAMNIILEDSATGTRWSVKKQP
ncbi:Cysteinyl-tRNA synthetase [hydrothermal vent metagenome]|uniref:Cysteine--tRNA ligase n=1 Tax=hydrothermal vent metagenome TaxID=652676 RepID=A0A3B0V081_9ZZZZ